MPAGFNARRTQLGAQASSLILGRKLIEPYLFWEPGQSIALLAPKYLSVV
jgi:hypothetical protein